MAPKKGRRPENPRFFPAAADLRAWLDAHHDSESELWVGLYKKDSGKASITWPELVDGLLCYGWIDGIRKSHGDASYVIRVTPRKPKSKWSAVNLKRARELIDLGLMTPSGHRAFDARNELETQQYSYERANAALGDEFEENFRRNTEAWTFFVTQPPSYRRLMTVWVVSAKKEETRRRRLDSLIAASASGRRITA